MALVLLLALKELIGFSRLMCLPRGRCSLKQPRCSTLTPHGSMFFLPQDVALCDDWERPFHGEGYGAPLGQVNKNE